MTARTDLQRVKVLDIDADGGYATVQTQVGSRLKVSLAVRNGKGAWPRVDEVWLISRMYGRNWTFAAILDGGTPPVLKVERDGADDLAVKLLDALIGLGLVTEDEGEQDFSGNDFTTVTEVKPLTSSASAGDDPVATADADATEQIPVPLWLGTFNTDGATRSNNAIIKDLRRLLRSPVQVLGLQEMSNGDRAKGFRDQVDNFLTGQGWKTLRHEGDNSEEWNWIAYDPKVLTLVDRGLEMLSDKIDDGTGIARYAVWGRFKHPKSGHRLVFVNTHLAPPGRFAAHYYTDALAALGSLVLGQSDLTYLVGDLNVNWRSSSYAQAGYPGAVLDGQGIAASYSLIAPPTAIGTHGKPLIDYVYQGPDSAGVGTVADQRIVRNMLSSHRPLLVRMQMRRKDTDVGR